MEILLIKLFLGHVIGDFILQPDKWIKDKEKNKLLSPYFYLHVLIHGVLLLLLLSIWDYRWVIITITLIHGVIDALKLIFQSDSNRRGWFFADQALHIISIVVVWYVIAQPDIDLTYINSAGFLLKTLAVLFITFPSAVIIRIIINKWNPEISGSSTLPISQTGNSLQSAGKYIGIIERLLVFTFTIVGHWEAIGFLIAAKSVFRFGDLKDAKDLKLTEYVLIGTLLSFGIAIAAALLVIQIT
ncbi:MAG TPA: DUF3307 domain-containing protein [Sphingobacteriaceae bacterium]